MFGIIVTKLSRGHGVKSTFLLGLGLQNKFKFCYTRSRSVEI